MADKITSTGSAIAALLVGAGIVMPSPNTTQPDIPDERPPIFQEDDNVVKDVSIINADPTHVGLVRVEDGTKWVTLVRPVGEAETCTRTVCDAVVGEQWTSKEGPNYVKQLDGSWKEYSREDRTTVQEVAMLVRPQCVNGVCTMTPRLTRTVQTVAYAVTPDIGGGGYGSAGSAVGYGSAGAAVGYRSRTLQRSNIFSRRRARVATRRMGYGSAGG